MTTLHEFQSRFRDAVLSDREAIHASIMNDGLSAAQRIQIHRNNTFITLTEALSAIHPAVARLVGDEFFAFTAGHYIRQHPPRSGTLIEFGDGLADFLASFAPAATLVYLPDVARLEWGWHEAFHAADAVPIDPDRLASLPRDRLPHVRFSFHPSLRLIASPYPILRIWQANVDEAAAGEGIDLSDGGDCLQIARPGTEVEVRRLPQDTFDFIRILTAGISVERAYAENLRTHAGFEPAMALRHLMTSGVVTDFGLDDAAGGEIGG